MVARPTFSIIMPTYNRADLISETLEQIFAQSFRDFEVLVIDDGSTDNTTEVVGSITDQRVKYFRIPNGERGAARNLGLRKANGRYAVFFDSDDWMHDEHLDILNLYIQSNPGNRYILATKHVLAESLNGKPRGGNFGLRSGFYGIEDLISGNAFGVLVAVDLSWADLHEFPEDRSYSTLEDWLFLLQNSTNHKIHLLDKITITVRNHCGRSMNNNSNVIRARISATEWALRHIPLTAAQRRRLSGHSRLFCGIHHYLDGNRLEAIQAGASAAARLGPTPKVIALLLKALLGKKLVGRLK